MSGHAPDPHLRKALAHAPDHDAGPPAHVSAQILAAAHRSAVTPARPRASLHTPWWRRPWGASGALATVLMAGFLGLLWHGDAPGPAVDGTAPEPARAAATTAAAPVLSVEEATVAPAVTAAPKPATTPTPTPTAAKASLPMQTQAATADARLRSLPSHKATADTAASPASVDPSADRVALQAPAAPAAMATRAAAPAAALALPSGLAAPAVHSSLPVLQAGDELRWLTHTKKGLPDAAWLQQLAALTRTRGPLPAQMQIQSSNHEQAATAADAAETSDPAGAANTTAVGLSLLWLRGGAALGTLRLESGAVWWCAADKTCMRAQVPQAALEDLIGKLPSER